MTIIKCEYCGRKTDVKDLIENKFCPDCTYNVIDDYNLKKERFMPINPHIKCGTVGVISEFWNLGSYEACVQCPKCKVIGPTVSSTEPFNKAIKGWNDQNPLKEIKTIKVQFARLIAAKNNIIVIEMPTFPGHVEWLEANINKTIHVTLESNKE